MEREAFARARRFLSYRSAARTLALVMSVLASVLYVALLMVLGLFADLVVSRGTIPSSRDLSVQQQNNLIRQTSEADARTTSAHEELWRRQVQAILTDRVGIDAAELARAARPDEPMEDLGILSLVVRSEGRLYRPVVSWLARWNPWLWQSRTESWPNMYYSLAGLFLWAVALSILRALVRFLMILGASQASVEASARLRRAVYHHTFRLGNLVLTPQGPSEAVSILTREVEGVHQALYVWLTVVFREPLKLVLLLLFALVLNFWLSLAFLFFALVVWLIGGQAAAHYRRQGREAMNRAAEQLTLIQESLKLMRLVKAYLMEVFNQSRVERQLARYARSQLLSHLGEAVYRPLLILLSSLGAACLMAVVGVLVYHRQVSIANAVTLAAALVSLYWPIVHCLEQRKTMRRGRAAAVALFEFLDRKSDVKQVEGADFLPALSKRIEFDNVELLEPGSHRMLLQGATLTINSGEVVGFIGTDEDEKHALLYLLARFLDPAKGEVRIDDQNLRWVTLESLRVQIGIVLQKDLIFNDTVANNIGCGDPGFTLPKIIEAAKMAHAHQFIQRLPQGYETPIGDLGHVLGLTEKFLIALARAILRDPAILVIEEPTVALDEATKALLEDTYNRILPGRTVLFLPHRISTIRSCDRIFLMNKGRVEAEGPHRDLVTTNDLYRHLHYLEFNDLVEQLAS